MADDRQDVQVVRIQSEWTPPTLKVLIETLERNTNDRFDAQYRNALTYRTGIDDRFAHLEQLFKQGYTNAQTAIDKAEAATAAKFQSVNEFRSTLSDQSDRMMPRVESEARHQANLEKLDAVAQQAATRDNALSARVDELNSRMLLREGRESGTKVTKDEGRVWNTNIIGWIVAAAIAAFAYFSKGHP